ncbi:MAG TPA: radical SAM protein [bacterium]|nr:radical SAM protein [bacterium]
MKIALIHPKIAYRCEDPSIQEYVNRWYREIFARAFNYNLLRLASLTPERHELRLIDENYEPIDFEENFDVIGVTAMTYQAERAYEIAAAFKKRGPCRTILGGIHASVMAEEAAGHFDSVCIGEVESIWENYLDDAEKGSVRPFYRGGLASLETEPMPRYSLVRHWVKPEQQHSFHYFPTMSTRGCPRGCDYCSATYLFEGKYRKKAIDRVLAEIRSIKATASELGLDNYHVEFCDDNFIIDRRRTKELLAALVDERIGYTASLDIAASDDPEVLELLSASGCKVVSIGLESLEVNILEDLGQWKKAQRQKVERNLRAFFDYGIMPAVNFMVGSDGTDRRLFSNIRNFLEEFPVLYNLLFFTPFPGTPYREQLGKQGRLRPDKTWQDYNLFNLVFEPAGMSKEELYEEFIGIRSEYDHLRQYLRIKRNLSAKKPEQALSQAIY